MNENEEFEFAMAMEQEAKPKAPQPIDYGFGTEAADPYVPPVPEATAFKKVANVVGGVNKGLFDVANMPFAMSKWAAEAVGQDPSTTFDLTDIPYVGDAVKPVIPKGLSPTSDLLRKGGEWFSGGVPKMTANVLKKAPVMADTAVDAMMAAGAMSGDVIGGDIGEVAGGFTGLMASILRGKMPTTAGSLMQTAKEATPFTLARENAKRVKADAKVANKAQEFVKENLANEVTARTTAASKGDEVGTLLDITEDVGLADINKGLTTSGRKQIGRAHV